MSSLQYIKNVFAMFAIDFQSYGFWTSGKSDKRIDSLQLNCSEVKKEKKFLRKLRKKPKRLPQIQLQLSQIVQKVHHCFSFLSSIYAAFCYSNQKFRSLQFHQRLQKIFNEFERQSKKPHLCKRLND